LGRDNLSVIDYWKHVFIFATRPSGKVIGIALKCQSFSEKSDKESKIETVLNEKPEDMFDIKEKRISLPLEAETLPSLRGSLCIGLVI
jgi:formylmethanofuran dehydrogenase subunit E